MARADVIGGRNSHDTLRRVLSARRPCKILDVPAGQGVLCTFLSEHGWEVHAADIDPGNFKVKDIPFTQANLNRSLPFNDASFDAVACVNGLHRLLFPHVAIREFYRILRPGGRLYINSNNYSSIWKRVRFLISGSVDYMVDTQECLQTTDDPEANVRSLLMYPRLSIILEQSGFRVVDVRSAAVTWRDRIFFPVAMLTYLFGWCMPLGQRRYLRLSQANRSGVLFGGDYVFIEAVKSS